MLGTFVVACWTGVWTYFEVFEAISGVRFKEVYAHIEKVVAFVGVTVSVLWSYLGTMKELRDAITTEFFLWASPTSLYLPEPSIQAVDLSF